MTIYDFLELSKKYPSAVRRDILQSNNVWSSEACKGYLEAAACAISLDPDTLSRLQSAMDAAMENMTVEQASVFHYYGDY